MTPETFRKVRELFDAAMEQAPEARASFLRMACPEGGEILAEVERLIASVGETQFSIDLARESHIIAASVTFTTGAKLGTYEILGLLGVGGMGEVYRAHDSRLRRDVAIKVLPQTVASDVERVARFEREARVLAQLNHRHIGAIYDLADFGDSRCLVLELVEGETLADRIQRGPMPIDEVLEVSRQIAEAVETAHEKGIVHRDLKPANIKIDPDGNVKVLDFGLAKVREPDSAALSSSSTLSGEPGRIMGTVPYMSPEQATGRDADRRSDIWAFGCLLYEMLTGQQAFDGETVNDILAAVLKSEPDFEKLPKRTPSTVRRLILRCLQKNRKQRLHDIADGRIAIEEAQNEPPGGIPGANPYAGRERLAWIVASVLAVGIVALSIPWETQPKRPPITIVVDTPQAVNMTEFALSPDGSKLAFIAIENSVTKLWLYTLTDSAPLSRALPDTEGAVFPFFSPDNEWIGFSADQRLKKISIISGKVETLGNHDSVFRGGSWNEKGDIIFGTATGPIYRISEEGGRADEWTTLQNGANGSQGSHRFPRFFPDGDRFLFSAAAGSDDLKGVYIGSLSNRGAAVLLLNDQTTKSAAAYLPDTDEVLYVGVDAGGENTLYRRKMNGSRLDPAAPQKRFISNLAEDPLSYNIGVSVSDTTGSVAYRQGPPCGQRQLQWLDLKGNLVKTVGKSTWKCLLNPSISPDGQYVAFSRIQDGYSEIYKLDLNEDRPEEPLTVGDKTDMYPIFSPDSKSIAFAKTLVTGLLDTYILSVGNPEKQEPLLSPIGRPITVNGPSDWYGEWLLYRRMDKKGWDLFAVQLDKGRKPVSTEKAVAATDNEERDGQFSPDGRFIAYQSNEEDQTDIWIRPFPEEGEPRRVTTNGCAQVRWFDKAHVTCIALDNGMLMKVALEFGSDGRTPSAKSLQALFQTNIGGALQATYRQQYDIVPDDKGVSRGYLMNVLLNKSSEQPIRITIRN